MAERESKKIVGIRIGEVPGGRPVRRVYKEQRKLRTAEQEPKPEQIQVPESKSYISEAGRQMPESDREKYDRLLEQKHESNLRSVVKETLAGVPNAEEVLRECDKIGWSNIEKINEIVDKALKEISEEPEEPKNENIFATEAYDGGQMDYDRIQEGIEKDMFNVLEEEDDDEWDDDEDDEEEEEEDGDYPMRGGFPYDGFRPDPVTMDNLNRDDRMKYMSAMELFRHTTEVLSTSRGDIYSQSQGFSRMFDDALAAAGGLISGEYGPQAAEQAVMWANSVSRYGVINNMKELYCRYIMDTVRYKMLYGNRIDEPYKEAMEIIAEMVRRS